MEVKSKAGDSAMIVQYDSGECIKFDTGPARTAVRTLVKRPPDISSMADTRSVLYESLYLDEASCSDMIFDSAIGIPVLVMTNASS